MPHFLVRCAGALLCALAGLLASTPAFAATAPAGHRPFAADSVWNLPLRADAPLDPRSAAYTAWLGAEVAAKGAYIDTTYCAMPIYWADAGTPTVRVLLAAGVYQDPALLRAWSAVPIPQGATAANCTDKNFAVVQRQPDGTTKEWEFWAAAKQPDGTWIARWGGAVDDLATDSGIASDHAWYDPTAPTAWASVSRPGWNVTASSVSMIAGVITRRDVEQGRIDHALSVALPDTARDRFLWPAQRTDGGSAHADAIPHGARLRLDPSLDLRTIPMVPLVRMMAEAAQKYGIVVRDKTHNNTAFYTEEVRAGEPNPFAPLLNGQYPDRAMKAFPWGSLRVLKATSCQNVTRCLTTDSVAIAMMPGSLGARAGLPLTLDTSGSTLNQPRTRVEWDLDGNGTYELDAGTAVKLTYTPTQSGTRTVRVRITMRGGGVAVGARSLTFAAAAPAPSPPATVTDAPPPAPPPAVATVTPPPPTSGGSAQTGRSVPSAKARRRSAQRRRAQKRRKARSAAKRSHSKHRRRAARSAGRAR